MTISLGSMEMTYTGSPKGMGVTQFAKAGLEAMMF